MTEQRNIVDGIIISPAADGPTTAQADNRSKPLAGLRLAIKDNIDVAGMPTTRGSRLYGAENALSTAPVVSALIDAGAHVVAKVNLHEFAYGASSDNPWHGRVPNPRYRGRIPGGSSGGSAAAVVAGLADLALGTDTAGSIRMPAACCTIAGLRPRNGLLNLSGVAPLCPSFDVVGPMAASVSEVRRAWLALDTAAAHEGNLEPQLPLTKPLRLASYAPLQASVVAVLDRLGFETVSIDLPCDDIERAFWPAFRAEAARSHEGTYPRFSGHYDPNVARKLAGAQGISYDTYRMSMEALRLLRARVLGLLDASEARAMIGPVLGCALPLADDDETDYRDDLGRYSIPASALNLAALAIGDLQLVARTESEVLAIGLELENAGLRPVPPPMD